MDKTREDRDMLCPHSKIKNWQNFHLNNQLDKTPPPFFNKIWYIFFYLDTYFITVQNPYK